MYILAICEEPAILNLILFVKGLMEILCTLIPIVLIIMVTIDLSKIVFDVSDKTIKASSKSIMNRILATVVIFFVPMIVNFILKNLNQMNVEQTACWANANTEKITYYQQIKDARTLSEKQEKQAKIVANNKKREQAEKERKDNLVEKPSSSSSVSGKGQARLVSVAEKELGNKGTKYKNFYGVDGDWCAMFVFWVAAHTPVNGNSKCTSRAGSDNCVYKKHINANAAYVSPYVEWIAKNKKFYHSKYYAQKYGTYKNGNKAYTPQPGDLIFFVREYEYHGNPKSCYAQPYHIGIVRDVKNDQVITIEGNTGSYSHYTSKVDSHKFSLGDSKIMGYGHWAN